MTTAFREKNKNPPVLQPCLSTKMQVAHQVGNHTGGASRNAWSSKICAGENAASTPINRTASVFEMPWGDLGSHQWCTVWLPHSACCTMNINHMTIMTAPGNEAHNACSHQDRPLQAKNDWTNLEFRFDCPVHWDVYTQLPAPLANAGILLQSSQNISPERSASKMRVKWVPSAEAKTMPDMHASRETNCSLVLVNSLK